MDQLYTRDGRFPQLANGISTRNSTRPLSKHALTMLQKEVIRLFDNNENIAFLVYSIEINQK